MAFAEQPFDEREQRFFLAEILKTSSISPHDILHLIQERRITPNWMDMLTPYGRSPAASKRAYDILINHSTGPPTPFQSAGALEQPPAVPKARKKRPAPGEGPATPADRTIQAQPFASVNTPSDATAFQIPPPPITGEPPQKKRGRPNKEEHERRVREAAERGEVYPRPRKTKTPRQSLEGAPSAAVTTPAVAEAGVVEESTSSKAKAKKPKATPAGASLAPEIPTRISSLEATASAADQMQIETDTEQAMKSTISETQTSEFPVQESLLAGLKEHAAQADTTQSSLTLKEESLPRSQWATYSATPNPPATSNPIAKLNSPAVPSPPATTTE